MRGRKGEVQKFSIEAVARQQLELARQAPAARSATTVFGGHEHALRQTVLGLKAGAVLAEHDNPGEATLYVIAGRVTLNADGDTWDGRAGDMIVVPPQRHSVTAEEDSAILLTAVPRNRSGTER
jgi:quercetin dioxygenase-like cupin family protein